MLYLKQSTASQAVLIGPCIDDTDGKTAKTGLTIANTDIRLSKNGANIAAKNSGGGTHDELGYYTITLDATDTNTVGRLQLMVQPTGALPVYHEYWVLEEAVYDALFAASAPGYVANAPVNVAQFGGSNLTAASGIPEVKVASLAANAITATAIATGAITNAKFAAGAIDAAAIAADAIGASELAADAATEIGTAVWATATRVLTAGTNIALAKGTGVTGFNDLSAAAVNAEVDTALADYDAPTKAELDSGLAGLNDPTAAAVADAVWDEATSGHSTAGTTGKALTDAGGAGTPPSAADVADAVWDELLSGHTTTGSAGDALGNVATGTPPSAAAIRAEIDSNSTQLAAIVADTNEIQAELADGGRTDLLIDAIKAKTDNIPGSPAAVGDIPTAGAVADAVLDEATSGHSTAGTVGKALTDILADTNELQSDDYPTSIAAVKGDTAAILIDTAEIGTAGAGLTNINLPNQTMDIVGNITGNLSGAVGSVTGNVGGNVTGSIGSLAAQAKADVNTEADTALTDYDGPTHAELTSEIGAVETDTQDIQARLPAALTGAGNLKADLLAISGDASAADSLEALMDGIIVGQVNDLSASVTSFAADGFTASVDDHFNGRLITFITGALTGQQTAITDYAGSGQTFTVDALTSAPANDVFFVIS